MPLSIGLLEDEAFRPHAIRAMAAYEDPRIPPRLLGQYATLAPAERQDVIQTLTARPAFALALLDAIEQADDRPAGCLGPRRSANCKPWTTKSVSERLAKVWGEVRPASAESSSGSASSRSSFRPRRSSWPMLAAAGPSMPRRAPRATSCSTKGAARAGADRLAAANLDYVLDNVLDPSAIVPREYRANVLRLADGRVVQGVIVEETPQTSSCKRPTKRSASRRRHRSPQGIGPVDDARGPVRSAVSRGNPRSGRLSGQPAAGAAASSGEPHERQSLKFRPSSFEPRPRTCVSAVEALRHRAFYHLADWPRSDVIGAVHCGVV